MTTRDELTGKERILLEGLRPTEGEDSAWRSIQDMRPMNMHSPEAEHLIELGLIERTSRNGEQTSRHWYRWRITEAGIALIGKRQKRPYTSKSGKTFWL